MKNKVVKYIKSLNKKKKILLSIIVCLTLVELSSMFLMYKSMNSKELDSVSLKKFDNSNGVFAVFLEQENSDYAQFEDTTWPSANSGYIYNINKSGCVDSEGNELVDALIYNKEEQKVSTKTKGTAYCYLYFDLYDDIEVAVSTDGTSGAVPTSAGYKASVSCDNASAYFNPKYQRIEFSDINNKSDCNLTYTQNTDSNTTLISEVEQKASLIQTPVFDNATTLTEEEYGTPNIFYNSSESNLEGTPIDNVFTFNDGVWTMDSSVLTSETYYHFSFYTQESGYYQLCYTMSAGYQANYLYAFFNNSYVSFNGQTRAEASADAETSGCINLGYYGVGGNIRIVRRVYTDIPSTNSFYIRKTNDYTSLNVGYRYKDKNPNNYVWFNNEMWRIIGSVPTCTTESCGTNTTNLVKIIRNNAIGEYPYDSSSTSYKSLKGAWGENTLYSLLNNYYYGAKNGTDSGICYSFYSAAYTNMIGDCDYTMNGISDKSTDYYGRMVKNVYWNTGAGSSYLSLEDEYNSEISKQSVSGNVGLVTISDIVYSTQKGYENISIHYNTGALSRSWLFDTNGEWTSTQDSVSTQSYNAYIYQMQGIFLNTNANNDFKVRPVVYLDPSVYVISGSGSISDPYIIGM